jgi:hypothetical protein
MLFLPDIKAGSGAMKKARREGKSDRALEALAVWRYRTPPASMEVGACGPPESNEPKDKVQRARGPPRYSVACSKQWPAGGVPSLGTSRYASTQLGTFPE